MFPCLFDNRSSSINTYCHRLCLLGLLLMYVPCNNVCLLPIWIWSNTNYSHFVTLFRKGPDKFHWLLLPTLLSHILRVRCICIFLLLCCILMRSVLKQSIIICTRNRH